WSSDVCSSDLGAGAAQQVHHRWRGGAAHDAVIHHNHALTFEHVGERVELEAHACFADALVRLDERAADVAVLHEAFAIRQAGFARVADGGRDRRIGYADDEIGIDRVLTGELRAHGFTGRVNKLPADTGIRAGKV